MSFFRKPFDLNRDGKVSGREKALAFGFLMHMIEEEEEQARREQELEDLAAECLADQEYDNKTHGGF
ncbi:hypothetical protein H9X85_12505 [Anaerotignum lactatifermentans]|uniref:EF-hand domain-containing protein n=1 Tax=Anaerotignum lactatifermentans TaxID=160404 RepID=A0ABS2GBV3_9FIRM|nr:hypothetical protein [Anaerotignum lactatifermentans]MBM6830433.1 hypothetical protein [Anaerotignum lactatifermentans]MBM6878964.1 hypothetical protein [Anaerotignum lactatifermentans]MBM6952000.1 hypothetical protein [Anaerotignum lactatifermentans]